MNMTERDIKQEQEANQFALGLLMPKEMFFDEWEKLRKVRPAMPEEQLATALANIFQVPLSAAYARMFQLGREFILQRLNQKQ